ncbi:MAG: hypothetical protein RIB58_05955 [Phycisphaerales bacterium]|jgi:hypothetical protein
MTRFVAALLLVAALVSSAGCNIVGFFGAIEAERRRTGTMLVEAEYEGLQGQSVAVVIDASRGIYMTSERIVGAIMVEITARLEANADVESIVPPDEVWRVMYDEPDLLDRTYDEIAERFGVTRLIVIQLDEFRLSESGNQYVWSGQAAGNLIVVEADSFIEDDVRLERYVNVTYPDKPNTTVDEMPAEEVALELLRRFANRASWFFYDHRERYPEHRTY